jgi:acetyl esterase/lipase
MRTCRRTAWRLLPAPEHPWPASADDAVAALRWVSGHPADLGPAAAATAAGQVAVDGDSAGGTLATLACLRLRDEDPRALPGLQVLLSPNTDLTGGQALRGLIRGDISIPSRGILAHKFHEHVKKGAV